MADENESEVRLKLLALQRMTTEELKEKWKALYGTTPPAYGDVFMRKRLAFRIQELVYGGLDDITKAKVEAVADGSIRRKSHRLKIGAVITREWRGNRYDVRVIADGFEWNGGVYGSLSAVARAITGVNRNGYIFFNLPKDTETRK